MGSPSARARSTPVPGRVRRGLYVTWAATDPDHLPHQRVHPLGLFRLDAEADRLPEVSDAELDQDFRQLRVLAVRGYIAGQGTAVLGPVLLIVVEGQTESPGLHSLVQELLHSIQLRVRDRCPLPGLHHPQHISPHRREWEHRPYIYAKALAVETVQVLRERLPIPAHPPAHGIQRDGLGCGSSSAC